MSEEIWQGQYSSDGSSVHQSLYPERDFLTQLSDEFAKKGEPSFAENRKIKTAIALQPPCPDSVVENQQLKADSGDTAAVHVKLSRDSLLENAFFILEEVRNQKSTLGKSLASSLSELKIRANSQQLSDFEFYKEDIAKASHVDIKNIVLEEQAHIQKPVVKIRLV